MVMMPLLLSILTGVVGLGIYILLVVLLYKFACSFIEKNPVAALGIAACGIFLFPVGVIIPFKVFGKIAKFASQKTQEQYAIMSELAIAPTDEKVDAFMARVDSEGGMLANNPDNWNSFRNLWFAVNESPDVTTQKKNLFCMWLSNKGLILSSKQARIIDNYKQKQ